MQMNKRNVVKPTNISKVRNVSASDLGWLA